MSEQKKFTTNGGVRMSEQKTFFINCEEGLDLAEQYQRVLYGRYDNVVVEAIEPDMVCVKGFNNAEKDGEWFV